MVWLVKFRSRDRTASKIIFVAVIKKTRIYVEIDFIFGKLV